MKEIWHKKQIAKYLHRMKEDKHKKNNYFESEKHPIRRDIGEIAELVNQNSSSPLNSYFSNKKNNKISKFIPEFQSPLFFKPKTLQNNLIIRQKVEKKPDHVYIFYYFLYYN